MTDLRDGGTYPGTCVLKNKTGLRDLTELKRFERGVTAIRIQALRENPVCGNYDLAHLQAIHRQIFGDVYAWAGVCTVDIAKGPDNERALLTFREKVFSRAAEVTAAIRGVGYLRRMNKAHFVDILAKVYAGLNEMRPFYDGNGLAIREFVWQLARESGYRLDYGKISKQAWGEALRQLANGSSALIRKVFYRIAMVERAVAFEKLPWHEALAKHPELDGAYKMLIDAQYVGQNVSFLRAEIIKELQTGCVVGDGVSIEESYRVINYAAAYRGLKVLGTDNLRRRYRGNVVAISAHHILLKVGNTAVCYERRNLDHAVHIGDCITIQHDHDSSQVHEQCQYTTYGYGCDMKMPCKHTLGQH